MRDTDVAVKMPMLELVVCIAVMESRTVPIRGSTSVSLSATALRSLNDMEDSALQREIAREALKAALSQRLAGFDGIQVQSTPTGDVAEIDFDGFSDCIRRLITAYDGASSRLARLESVAEVFKVHLDSLPDACVDAAKEVMLVAQEEEAAQEAADAETAKLAEERANALEPLSTSEEDASEGSAPEESREDQMRRLGYQPLLDDGEEDTHPPALE